MKRVLKHRLNKQKQSGSDEFEVLYQQYLQEVMPDNSYLKQMTSMDYTSLFYFLQSKYGVPNGDYFRIRDGKCLFVNRSIQRSGVELHHLDENQRAMLSDLRIANSVSINYQKASHLTYSNLLEHTVLHVLIARETLTDILGYGGLYNFGMLIRLFVARNEYGLSVNDILYLIKVTVKKESQVWQDMWKDKTITAIKQIVTPHCPIIIPAFQQQQQFNLNAQLAIHNNILMRYDKGIHQISVNEAITLIPQGIGLGHFKKCNKVYILRNENDTTMMIGQSKTTNHLMLFRGGMPKTLPHDDIQWYYNHMNDYIKKASVAVSILMQKLLPLINFIRQQGGEGNLHGLNIDIDSVHHVYYNRNDNTFHPFYALDTSSRTEYRTLLEMMPIQSIEMKNSLPVLYKGSKGLDLPIFVEKTKEIKTANDTIYGIDANLRWFFVEKSFVFNHIIYWDEEIAELNIFNDLEIPSRATVAILLSQGEK